MGSQYKTIGDNLLSKMSKQLKMKCVADFRRYVECTYSKDSYIDFLKKEGLL
jgi:tRNA A37 threonylcarbamoyladenosine dehydratase